ncbi:MAG: CHASE2 domain-containing protein [Thioploca sp.]|nr:CHASE2 domain-containing protein [Thioploca sp.]
MNNIQEKIWSHDWFISLTIGIILFIMAQLNLLQPLEQALYDAHIRWFNRTAGDQVAVIAIDERSLAQLGDWPWSRTTLAQLIDLLSPQAQVISTTLPFNHFQPELGLVYFNELVKFYTHSKLLNPLPKQLEQLNTFLKKLSELRTRQSNKQFIKAIDEFYKNSIFPHELVDTLTTFEDKLQSVRIDLESDQRLATSFKTAGQVVLGIPFTLAQTNHEEPVPNLPNYITAYRLKNIRDQFDHYNLTPQPPTAIHATSPLAIFSENVTGLGYFNAEQLTNPRRIPLVIKYNQAYFPSLPLLLAAKSLHLDNNQIEISLGKGIRLEKLTIKTEPSLQIQPFFYRHAPPPDSFVDVLTGRVPIQKYQGKTVLLGITVRHYTSFHSTPIGKIPAILVLAHTLRSLLNQDFFRIPQWATWLQISLLLLVAATVGLLLPHLRRRQALVTGLGLMGVLYLLYFSLLNQGLLVQLMHGILLVPCGYLALQIKQGIVAYQDAFRSHPDAVESNRLLGLAFQGQGQLDMAFEKFRLCPPDNAIMGLLYNLALDYERKRQWRRASAVYRYMLNYIAHFRDIEQRLERLNRLRKPHLSKGAINDWLSPEDNNDKPILGRYQIEKPLGKGAMGTVYLGKDSKLNRLVAIKTLPLSQEFEAEGLQEATIRFFREAAAAGRLKHPNIVSIYDAGEEQDLAFISMEFFKGGNLVPYTQSDNLLAIATVIKIGVYIAEALDYAHSQGVVHRDIKPANIMYNPATDQIKITDFGIARITDSNKTKTGIILGTPSYMSPEQLAGKSLDGRTDLFSLGVMLYQLLTGILPFQADSMATLMFKIANEPHPDMISIRPDIPPSLKQVVDITLQKNAQDRYQNGAQLAQALRDCGNLNED